MNTSRTGQPSHAASPRPRPRVDEVTLAVRKTAKSSVWRLVHLRVQDWGLLDLLPDAEWVAVELVARAVETTGVAADEPRWFKIKELPIIGVRVSADHGVLLIQVRDSDSTSPYPPKGAYLDRHLMAVNELSRKWNWYPLNDGKVIWAELVPRQAQPPAFLPQRTAGSFFYPESEAPVAPFRDMALTQRVLDGLRRLGVEGRRDDEL